MDIFFTLERCQAVLTLATKGQACFQCAKEKADLQAPLQRCAGCSRMYYCSSGGSGFFFLFLSLWHVLRMLKLELLFQSVKRSATTTIRSFFETHSSVSSRRTGPITNPSAKPSAPLKLRMACSCAPHCPF